MLTVQILKNTSQKISEYSIFPPSKPSRQVLNNGCYSDNASKANKIKCQRKNFKTYVSKLPPILVS